MMRGFLLLIAVFVFEQSGGELLVIKIDML